MSRPQLSVLIPAAGASRRLGRIKQLVPYGSGTLVQNAVDIAASLDPAEIMVITGAHAAKVRNAAHHAALRWIHNPRWSTGLGSSIAAGAANVHPGSDGLLILLCDQWRLRPQDLQSLVTAWHSSPEGIAAATADGAYMPPVIFPAVCFKQLQALEGDRGARSLFDSHPGLVTPVALENARFDLDSRAHLELLKAPVCNK